MSSSSGSQLPFARGAMYHRPSWAASDAVNYSDSPYPGTTSSPSLQARYSLGPDPAQWGVSLEDEDPDDELHRPDPEKSEKFTGIERSGHPMSMRGLTNLGCLLILLAGIFALFIGYPVISALNGSLGINPSFNIGGTGANSTGQVPGIPGNWGLIDTETPLESYTMASWEGNGDMQLVFSDEFNTDGRSFYPGDDPFWESVDLHYWETNNLEWYDPEAVTTKGGSLVITLSEKPTHNLNFEGGLLSTWNKFCFTGGYIETRVILPGANNVMGFWPAVWTMGNLGRAGYGASLDGLWPYTYDSCDVGTVQNQTVNGLPEAATVHGDTGHHGELSWLPGQRLSRCTCPGESHPGPMHSDGTFVGRSAPEIDVFEAQINKNRVSQVSQSAQWAPFDAAYEWFNTTDNLQIPNPSISALNTFKGSITQEATSVVSSTDPTAYELNGNQFSIYGFEYKPGFDDAYITWISNNVVSWTIRSGGLAANPLTNISARPIPQEPMYIIANLGMSFNFGNVELNQLTFPSSMHVDYIRVYQPKNAINIGCNPPDFPTQAYINQYIDAYTNPNFTSWSDDFGQSWPRNSFLGQC
ncbi:beta-glucan synthesis-associated [Roridomyces roridus]|uniref:Beta-glucan synthesis-associated n=1 Tax=Roridomyces roridus TaxID=1738132 RepID=A0AAD7G028_9AGAR|nr:beta-glucan synthesis-associated [Roridomyces roridus]